MNMPLFVIPLLCGIVLTAAPQLPSGVTSPSTAQPVIRETLTTGTEPVRSARGWAVNPEATLETEVPGVVGSGPGVRITTATGVTVFRPAWSLGGMFSVAASFQSAQPDVTFGLTLGGAKGLALLVRSDGAFSVQPLSGGKPAGGSWTSVSLRATDEGTAAENRLEVKVRGAEAVFVINGQVVQTLPIAPGQLDGAPGVHVAASADVVIAGFTIERVAQLLSEGVK
jgi:hypothetical protein